MIYLLCLTILLVIISFFFNRKKTLKALKIALKKFLKIIIPLLFMLMILSLVLALIPQEVIAAHLTNGNKLTQTIIASLIGSITIMPGFIAFPLSGVLRENGVPYMVLSALTTTLMMVGIITFPIEKKYFGTKVAIIRNTISFFIALTVAIVTGLLFGELL